MAMDVTVNSRLVFTLVHDAGIYGLPSPARFKCVRGALTAGDLVNRKLHRERPNELWVTDMTEHRTREGKLYCCCVLDAYGRKIVGWSIGLGPGHAAGHQRLDMAIGNLAPAPGGIVHADDGPQFTSCAFGDRIRRAGLMRSFGSTTSSRGSQPRRSGV